MATREILNELATQFSRGHSAAITTEAAGGVDVAKRVQAGEAVDIVVLANNAIDKLIAAGKLLADSRTDLVRSGIAIAIRHHAPQLDIGSEEAVKRAVLNAKSLSYSTGPSGVYLEQLFARWAILDAIKSKIVVPPPGVPVGTLVAKGECELGFQQLSELMNLPGIEVLGPLPPEIQSITMFTGAVSVASPHAEAARQALHFMASPTTATTKKKFGMEPA